MNTTVLDPAARPISGRRPLNGFFRKLVLGRLQSLEHGALTIREGDRVLHAGKRASADDPEVEIRVHHPDFYRAVALGGSIGAGEAYMAGLWSASDLVDLVRIFILNMDLIQKLDTGWGRLLIPVHGLLHRLNRNTLSGSRRNIAAHYDLSNEFFALFLDETLSYSCAIFEEEGQPLRDASVAKNERVCRKLDIGPEDHVLEIGSGWGGFAIHAASHRGCRVTTTTISREQYALARERVRKAGLEDRVTVLLEDYRHLRGKYDKLVSIEMIEAVGHQYLDTYFRKCGELLEPGGQMLLQCITIAESRFREHTRSTDFIKRYIFPGSCLLSVRTIMDSIARVTDLGLFHLEDITPHYVTTLRRWRERFFRNLPAIGALGYDERFLRMWEFYLCYCEGAFAERYIGDVQMVFTKPRCRRRPILPPLVTPVERSR